MGRGPGLNLFAKSIKEDVKISIKNKLPLADKNLLHHHPPHDHLIANSFANWKESFKIFFWPFFMSFYVAFP